MAEPDKPSVGKDQCAIGHDCYNVLSVTNTYSGVVFFIFHTQTHKHACTHTNTHRLLSKLLFTYNPPTSVKDQVDEKGDVQSFSLILTYFSPHLTYAASATNALSSELGQVVKGLISSLMCTKTGQL